MSWSIRIAILCAGAFGLVLGWYGSAALAGPAMRIHVIFPRALAALVGAGAAGVGVYLWRIRKRKMWTLVVASLAVFAIVGLGFWMMVISSNPA